MDARSRFPAGLVAGLAALLLAVAPAAAHRCGRHLVVPGDRTHEVWRKCGEPHFVDEVGETLTPDGRTVVKIVEWVYATPYGVDHVLVFEGGELVRERSVRR